ncbi:MAG: short-chain dehydrogenase [Chloroflexi bacterium]|nr:MAG: short-chain dehydrogenase [Chloroflexota bacterium]
MDLGLKGKTAIVTGGGSNIGRAIALTLAREGTNVVIAEIDEAQGNKVAAEANALKAGGETVVIKTDVTDLASVEEMVKKTLEKFGKIDILINNVGWDNLMFFVETTPEFWDKVITLNYKSVLNCVKAVLPHMIERKSGSIVSMGSDAGRVGDPREAVYGGTKGAIISFTKAVARENGRYGIRLNVVCPGATIPDRAEDIGEQSMWKMGFEFFTPELKEKWAKSYALRRLGTPQEVANAVVFLASDAASFITGQTLSVSGGYSMM